MKQHTYYAVVSIIFAVLALLHAARLYFGWEANMGGYDIPIWVSWYAVAISGYLAMRGWMFVQKKPRR